MSRAWHKAKGATPGTWVIWGVGKLDQTVFGTVEKVYGPAWFASTWLHTQPRAGAEATYPTLKEAAQWVADQYQPTIYTVHLSPHTDHLTVDGVELTKRPYPFHVTEDGLVLAQELWKGDPFRVIGVQDDLAVQQVDLHWRAIVGNPDVAVGKYLVTQDQIGGIATQTAAIEKIEVTRP